MVNTIIIKNDDTSGNTPADNELVTGELAVNTADGKLFYGDNNGDAQEFSMSGIALTDLSVGSEGSASGDGAISYNNSTGVFQYTPPVHDSLSGFVANEHIDHSGVSITAGNGLTGGGTIASSRTLNVVGGTGITANANDIQITNGGVDTTQLADDAVTTAKINDGDVTNAKLAGSIDDSKLNQITTQNKVHVSSLDIDAATDIGEALADADLFIVDNGANSTERKSTMSRVKTYVLSDSTATPASGDSFLTLDSDGSTTQRTTVDALATLLAGSNLSASNGVLSATDTNTQLSTEQVQDIVGAMFSGNTETRISATYQDGDGTIDLAVDDMTANDNDDVSVANLKTRLAGGFGSNAVTIGDTNDVVTIGGSLDLGDGNITNVGDIQLDSITGDGDTNTSITFSGSDVITFETGGSDVAKFEADGDLQLLQDLILKHDVARIKFGNDAEVELTHVADTGLLLDADSGTPTLQFVNSGESVSSDGSKLILTSNGVAFKMPTNDGSNNHVLQTDGSGNLSFGAVSGGASALNDLSDVTYSSGDLTISSLDKIISGAITHDSSGTITLDGTGGISLKEGGSNTTLIRPTDFNGKGTILKSSNVQYYFASTDSSTFSANSSNVGDANTNVRFLPFNTHATADAADEPEHCFQAPCNGHVVAVFASSNNNLVKPFDPGQGFLAWQCHLQILERDGQGGANIFGGSVGSGDSRVTGTNTSATEIDGINHTNGEYQECLFPVGGTDIFPLVKGNFYSFVLRFSKMNFDESLGTNGTTSKNQTLHLTYIISWDETTSGSTLGDWSGY